MNTAPLRMVFAASILVTLGLASVAMSALVTGLSALLVAIVLGVIIGNMVAAPVAVAKDLSLLSKWFLRVGIVLLGFKLSLLSLIDLGLDGIAVLLVTVVVTFFGTIVIGRALGVSRGTRLLVATGFSICGASAVAAMAGVVDPEGKREDETAQAVALVTIFGTIAMLALPALVPLLGLSESQSGLWIGASVQEVGQVVAAGGMVSTGVLAYATIAKLGRVVLLAPVIAIAGAVLPKVTGTTGRAKRPPLVPLFVVGFLCAVLARSFVPLPAEVWILLDVVANIVLATAMVGLGFAVDIRKLLATGWRPFVLGAVSTALVTATALGALQVLTVE